MSLSLTPGRRKEGSVGELYGGLPDSKEVDVLFNKVRKFFFKSIQE